MSRVFASLAIPNYRRYFAGALVSNTGTWMTRTAMSWLVLVELTRSDMGALGLLTGAMFLPSLLLSAWAGTLADRFGKRRIMLTTQSVLLLNAVALGVLVTTGHAQLWHVFALAILDGTATAIDAPARQAFVSELVPTELLPNAISMNSMSFNAARLVGPGIAGILIAVAGTGPVFLVNGATFAAILGVLATLDVRQLRPSPRSRGGSHRNLLEGLRYVRGRPDLVLLLFIGLMMGNFGFNFAITNPIMAHNVFAQGPTEFGVLGSLMGVGALAASLLAAARKRPRIRYVLGATAGFSAFSLVSALAPSFEVFALTMIPIGLCAVTTMVTGNTLVQVSLHPQMRGRVMSLWMLVVMGGTPIVGPLIGWVGTVLGPRATVMVGVVGLGVTAIAATAWLMRHDGIRLQLDWDGFVPSLHFVRGQVTEAVSDERR